MKKILIIAALFLGVACANKQTAPVNTAPQFYTHTISSQGETLGNIAKWYTGSANNWQSILSYNPGIDVRRMQIGTQIQIPNNMLVKTTAMPKSRVTSMPKQNKDVELLAPAEQSLALSQIEAENAAEVAAVAAADAAALAAVDAAEMNSNQNTETMPYDDSFANENQLQELTADDIAAMDNHYGGVQNGQAAEESSPQKKSILSKFQEAALKAQEKSIGGSGTPQAVEPGLALSEVDKVNGAAKANNTQNAVNAQEQANEALNKSQKDIDAANQNSNKTREDLIKELTQDY